METIAYPSNRNVLPNQLKILTWNCQGLPASHRGDRFPLLAKKIKDLSPDVVFLQEIIFSGDEKYFHLEGYHRAFQPRGPVMHGGLMTLCRKPLQGMCFTSFQRQGAWHNLQVTDRLLGKGYLEVEVPEWGLCLLNTHLVSTYRERVFREDENQAAQLEQLLGRAGRMDRVVMGGDFNFMGGTPYHARVGEVLEDVSLGLHSMGLTNCQPKIDHIFLRGMDWRESGCRFVPPGHVDLKDRPVALTDHAGVFVSVRVGEGPLEPREPSFLWKEAGRVAEVRRG